MAAIHLLILSLLTLTLTPKPILSLPLHKIPNFDPDIALLGDAEIVDAGSSVHLTRPTPSSSGLLLNAKPFAFLQPTSFSTDFSFSSDGVALVLAPADLLQRFPAESNSPFGIPRGSKLFAVEFDASTHDVVSVRVSNVSSPLNLALTNGVKGKVQAWVDYVASAKRLEVRLTETGASRPYNPLISFPIDLSKMWKGEEVLVGISSSSGNSKQISSVYSWRFRVRSVPNWMHSQPVDPMQYSDEGGEQKKEHKGSSCPLTVVCGLMLGMACGALVAFIAFFLWTIAVNRHNGIPLEYLKHPVGFGYEKVSVVVEK
ncbi:hypothetical protein RHSIM_Rhsim09G0171000 [Rhododendron simsii]|uniref:Legume lectin domain-containing protein n=1 Tax=Rhododendron simsii TaxID=118357 RepID=A0A834GCW5_RHOSS|nr:hypothetical protein RHSIM_Rhsim09G0171000 [Rhododendron simsii]